MQGVVGAELRYSGMWSCFKDIVKTESVSSLCLMNVNNFVFVT